MDGTGRCRCASNSSAVCARPSSFCSGGWLRAPHRLRQRRQPAARARHVAAARDRGSLRTRRETLANPQAADGGEPRAVAGGGVPGWPSAGGARRAAADVARRCCRRWPTRRSTGAWSRSRRSSRSSPASCSAACPALQTSRVHLDEGLREGARGSVGSRRAHRTRNVLVVVEVALAAMLLILASLLIQTFVRLLNVEPAFRPTAC